MEKLPYSEEGPEFILKSIVEKFVPKDFKEIVSEKIMSVNNWLDSIEAILRRIGWEMGRIKRVMCEKGISWGFFNDHGTDWHCNAHLNNFIVTQPTLWKDDYFLLPLDYDFAYTKE